MGWISSTDALPVIALGIERLGRGIDRYLATRRIER